MDELRVLARYVTAVDCERLPPDVVHQAQRVLLDTIGACVAGSADTASRALTGSIAHGGHAAPCSVLGTTRRASAGEAATLNGVAGVSLELDEGHAMARGHPAAHVVPVVLALAEETGASGAEVLAALVAGYEVGVRIGRALTLPAELGAHGTWSTVAAAAAAARLLRLDELRTEQALAMAFPFMIAAPGPAAVFGGHALRNLCSGLSARNGLVAARAAAAGVTAPRTTGDIVIAAFGAQLDAAALLDGLAEEHLILSNYFKPHALCRHLHAPLDLQRSLRTQSGFEARAVVQVEVHSHALVTRFADPRPPNVFAARFSVPFALAADLLMRPPLQWTATDVCEPEVLAAADKVRVIEDLDATAAYPNERQTRLVVRLRDDISLEARSRSAWGDPAQPMSDAALEAKFADVVTPVLGAPAVALALEGWRDWHMEPSVTGILRGIAPPP